MTVKLEELKTDAQVLGIVGKEAVKIISSQMMGDACQVVFRDSQGNINSQILFRDAESLLEIKIREGIGVLKVTVKN